MAQLNNTQINGNLTVTGKASLASTADTTPTSNYDLTSKKYVDDQISELNSNIDTLINGGQNWGGKAFDFSLDAMQGGNLVYGCWGPSFFPYGSNTSGAPSAWPGLMLAFTLPYGSEGWTRQVKIAFELSGDIYFIRFKNGTIDKSWTKIAGPEN